LDGEIRRLLNVYVNGEDLLFVVIIATALKDGDDVSIVPAVAGG
jgi:molybdopterin synthase sulfur carrier subunit